jgi:hypothetical protein
MSLHYDELVAGNCFGEINLTTPSASVSSSTSDHSPAIINDKPILNLSDEFGYSLQDLFDFARCFLKGCVASIVRSILMRECFRFYFVELKKNQAKQIKYNDNLRFIALSKQATIGQWNAALTKNLGFLDVIGNDRK